MLVWCWASVVNGWPTSNQHWPNVSSLLGPSWERPYIGLHSIAGLHSFWPDLFNYFRFVVNRRRNLNHSWPKWVYRPPQVKQPIITHEWVTSFSHNVVFTVRRISVSVRCTLLPIITVYKCIIIMYVFWCIYLSPYMIRVHICTRIMYGYNMVINLILFYLVSAYIALQL